MVRPVFSQRVRFNLITHDNLLPTPQLGDDNAKKDEYDEDNDEDSDEV